MANLFFAEPHLETRFGGLWKWAPNRPMNFLAIAKRDKQGDLEALDRAKDPEVEMIARTLLGPRERLKNHVDIGYGLPGNVVIIFHDDLKDALADQYEFFEGSKDRITAWPKWKYIKNRIQDIKSKNCIYRITYHKKEIYGAYVLVNYKQPESLQIRCLETALLMALGVKYASPEMMEEDFGPNFEKVLKIYDQEFPPGMSRSDFERKWKE